MTVRYDDFMMGLPRATQLNDFVVTDNVSIAPRVKAEDATKAIPDYTDHLNSRKEAAARTRQSFENKMQPTIHVQMQVRKIVAEHYEAARRVAFEGLVANEETRIMLGRLGIGFLKQFVDVARVAKEVDGTYTVTLP